MSSKIISELKPDGKPIKAATVKSLLFVLGRGIQAAAQWDEEVKKEVDQWEDDFSIMFEVIPNGPYMSLEKKDGKLRFVGLKKTDAELVISFKNIDSAFLVFTAQMSTPEGYAQHRMSVKGDLSKSMSLIRCLNIVQFLLFPGLISKRILKRMPKMTPRRWGIRIYAYAVTIPLGI